MTEAPPPRPPRGMRWPDKLVDLAGWAAGFLLMAMMLVTVVDVAGRYFLGVPFRGAFEISQILMAAIVFAGLPHVSKRETHITIDLFDNATPEALVPYRSVMVNFFCTACFAVFAWRLWVLAQEAVEFGDVTQYLGFPRAPVIYFGAALCAVTATIHLARIFAALRQIGGRAERPRT